MPWTRPQHLEIRQLIGEGWAGGVYLATDLDTSGSVAVRLIRPELVPEVGRLVQVLQPGATLGLPHALPTSLPEAHDSQLFYAMPLAPGGSLRGLLARPGEGPVTDLLTVLDLTRQIGEGLAAAHAQGTLHGNLKPENVLLWPLGAGQPRAYDVQLSDFGLNTLRAPDPQSPYLSAEQRVGAPVSVQDDLYGTGAILFELLTRRPPPPAPQPEDLNGLPEPVRKLLGRCFGWPAAFADAASFLGTLRAAQRRIGVGLAGPGAQLTADASGFSLTPGTPHTLQLRLTGREVQASVTVEGWPPEWVRVSPGGVSLRPDAELVSHAEFLVPRDPAARPGPHDVTVLVLDAGREVLARWPLHIEVLPFDAPTLELVASGGGARRAATLEAVLKNGGNQPRLYHLELQLPPGSRLHSGSAGQQFELGPGAEYRETFGVTLPLALGSGRRHTLTLLAQSRAPGSESWLPRMNSVQAKAELLQRPALPWWGLGLGLAGLTGLTAWAAQPPRIDSFALKGPPPLRGEAFTLKWHTHGARQVQLLEAPGEALPGQGERQMTALNSAQTYTLVARGLLSQRSEQLTVTPVMPAPALVAFKVTPAQARAGQSVTVQWNVSHVPEVELSPFGKVPPSGTRQLVIDKNTPLDLRAGPVGAGGLHSRLTVTVGAPQIGLFKLSPATAEPGQPVTVSWQTTGATQVRMEPLGALPAAGTRSFVPARSGKFTLKVSNGQQEVQSSAVVKLARRGATITSFTATPASPVVGQPLTLRWAAQGSQQVTLRWSDQQQVLPPRGAVTLSTTPQMQNLTLVAQAPGTLPALRSLNLKVLPAPTPASASAPAPQVVLPSSAAPSPEPLPASTRPAPSTKLAVQPPVVRVAGFHAEPTRVALGQPVSLRWQVGGVKRVSLIGPDLRFIGAFAARGVYSARPAHTGRQTFRLVAGDEVAQATVTVTPPAPSPVSRPKSTRPAPSREIPAVPVPPPAPARIVIKGFRASPATVAAGQPTTLRWNVSGTHSVRLSGMRGPNLDGSFPATGQVQTPPLFQPVTYTLTTPQGQATVRIVPFSTTRSGSPGQRVSIPAIPGSRTTAPVPSPRPLPPVSGLDPSVYAPLAGTWTHPYGQLNVQVSGSRATGTLLSSSPDLPSGSLRGTFSGEATAPVLNAFVLGPEGRVALIIRFDPSRQRFDGFYSSRSNRVRWCGVRGPAAPDCR